MRRRAFTADQLGKTFGQTFVVDSRGRAGGTVELVRAAPDAYTVGMITVGSHGIHPTLYAKLACDPYRDFTPISMFASLPNPLALHPSAPALIALLKKNPGKYTFCSSGAGASPERSKIMPEIPAVAETVPAFAATSWYGLAGPAGLPQPIVERLEAALREILAKPEVIKRYAALGTDIPPLGKACLDKFYPEEIARWALVVRASGARVV